VSPRPYTIGRKRQTAIKATRTRIIAAARDLLADPDASAFSIDAVATRANVARMTVYYQFKSKSKLLEAIFDDVAVRANMSSLRKAFTEPDPARGLKTLVDVFCNLWKIHGGMARRLVALATLDPEVDRALRERQSWRHEALTEIVGRMKVKGNAAAVVDVLQVLTSFETYDALAAAGRAPREIARLLARVCAAIVATGVTD
jgi:AcrR family transcriptional regulator